MICLLLNHSCLQLLIKMDDFVKNILKDWKFECLSETFKRKSSQPHEVMFPCLDTVEFFIIITFLEIVVSKPSFCGVSAAFLCILATFFVIVKPTASGSD